MKEQKVHAVIDLGSGTIKFLAGSIYKNKPLVYKSLIKRTSAQGFKDGKIINPKEVASNIKVALQDVKKSLKINIESVWLSVPPEKMQVAKAVGTVRVNNEQRIIDGHVLSNVTNAIQASIDQIEQKIIYNDPQVGYIDGQEFAINNLKGQKGEELKVQALVYSIPKPTYEKYKFTLKMAGLDIVNINISPIAISQELAVDTKGISIVVDIGHHKTYASVFNQGALGQTHTINWAGKHITYEIDTRMSINNYGTSSIWKHKHAKIGEKNLTLLHVDDNGKKWTVGDLNKITQWNVYKIIKELQAFIKTSGIENQELDIIITGGSANILNIDKYFQHHLKQNTRIYKPTTIGARKPEFTAMIGMLYSADRYAKQKLLYDQEISSLDISGWFNKKSPNLFVDKLKKWAAVKKG